MLLKIFEVINHVLRDNLDKLVMVFRAITGRIIVECTTMASELDDVDSLDVNVS